MSRSRGKDRLVRSGRRAIYRLRRALRRPLVAPIAPPIFIVGCGHSGTTLLLSILSTHSRLYAVPYESSLMERSPADTEWFVRSFNRETHAAGKKRWVEKTPRHIHHIAALLARFPEAKVVVMMRDGRDVACSLRDRSGDFAAAIQRWLDDNAAAEPFLDHDVTFLLRYENLIADPESQLRDLAAFLGEAFEPAMLEHHATPFRFLGRFEQSAEFAAQLEELTSRPESAAGSNHRRYRSWQAQQPIFDGRGRWYDQLSPAERAQFKAVAGERLIAYGYAADDTW